MVRQTFDFHMADDLAQETAELDPDALGDTDAIHWHFDTHRNIFNELFEVDMGNSVGRQMILDILNDGATFFLAAGKVKTVVGNWPGFISRRMVANSAPSTINFSGWPLEE